MINLEKNNKFKALLFALLALLILVFFTTNIYSSLQANLDQKDLNIQELEWLNKKLDELNNLKIKLSDDSLEETKKIKKFSSDFSEDEIILYINDYIESVNSHDERVVLFLESINFSEKTKSELWFNLVNIDLKVTASEKAYLINLLKYLMSSTNKYSFFVTEFSFPIEKKSWEYNVNIPLKLYVK